MDANKNLKIADFGVARIEAIDQSEMTGETGTYGYMAPEVHCSQICSKYCEVGRKSQIVFFLIYGFVGCKWQAL